MAPPVLEHTTLFAMQVPVRLRDRAKAIAKALSTTMSELTRQALTEKLDYLEAKILAERQREAALKKATQPQRSVRSLQPLANAKPVETHDAEKPEELPEVYHQHAGRILEAIQAGSPTETRLRLAEAVEAVKKQNPLTHPRDNVIVAALEKLVLAKREEAEQAAKTTATTTVVTTATTVVTEPEKPEDEPIVIDTSRIRSFGRV